MSVEATTDSGSVQGLGASIAPAAAVEGAEPATKTEAASVVITREQTEIEKRENADKALTADLMKVWEKDNPNRFADGKFAPKSDETTDATSGAEDTATTDASDTATTGQAPKAKDEPAKPAIDPPLSWSADMKAKWAALPPELQTYVSQRDKETHDAISRNGQQVKEYEQRVKGYEPLDQLVSVYREDFARRGVSPAQAFATLLDAQRKLDSNPVDGLVQIGLGYGIDLRPVFQGGQPQQLQQDPEVARLKAELKEMRDWRSTQESRTVAQERASQEKQLSQTVQIIEDFAKDKSYWADVEADVMHEVAVIKAKTPELAPKDVLAQAYERATWANSDVRQRIQTDQRKAEEDKRKTEAEAKAKAARSAASVNVKSGSPGTASPKTMDDTLRDIAAKAYGRASAA